MNRPNTGNKAVNWLIEKANECSDGTLVLTKITVPEKMYTDIAEYVRNLDTELKEIQPRLFNWVENSWWFDFHPVSHKRRSSRARFENNRVEVYFECGIYS